MPKLDLLPEEKTSSTITDFSKGINEIQRFNQGAEASAQTVVKFNSVGKCMMINFCIEKGGENQILASY